MKDQDLVHVFEGKDGPILHINMTYSLSMLKPLGAFAGWLGTIRSVYNAIEIVLHLPESYSQDDLPAIEGIKVKWEFDL